MELEVKQKTTTIVSIGVFGDKTVEFQYSHTDGSLPTTVNFSMQSNGVNVSGNYFKENKRFALVTTSVTNEELGIITAIHLKCVELTGDSEVEETEAE